MNKKPTLLLQLIIVFLFLNQIVFAQDNDLIIKLQFINKVKTDVSRFRFYFKKPKIDQSIDFEIYNVSITKFLTSVNTIDYIKENNSIIKEKEVLVTYKYIQQMVIGQFTTIYWMNYYNQLLICTQQLDKCKEVVQSHQKIIKLACAIFGNKDWLHVLEPQATGQLIKNNHELNTLQKQKTVNKLLIGVVFLFLILILILIWGYQFRKRESFIFGLSRVQLQHDIQKKELIIRELHHRVKNNFQLISSLMNIQSMDNLMSVEEFVKRTNSRIFSLSSIHERLYFKENSHQLDAIEYVKEMVQHTQNSFLDLNSKVTFKFSDDVVIVDIEIITYLCLIINELLINTYKYAFKDNSEGIIEIKIQHINPSKLHLIYTDNGVGHNKNARVINGIGLSIISALCKQLGANPQINFENGAHFEIELKTTTNKSQFTNDFR